MDTELFNILYGAIFKIIRWELIRDAATETYPTEEQRKQIVEFSIYDGCTSFNGDDIQEELKFLLAVKKIFIRIEPDQISLQVIQKLLHLNPAETPELDVLSYEMAKKAIEAIVSEGCDIKGEVVLFYNGDRIKVCRDTKEIRIKFYLNGKQFDEGLFASANGFKIRFDLPTYLEYKNGDIINKKIVRYVRDRWLEFKKRIGQNLPIEAGADGEDVFPEIDSKDEDENRNEDEDQAEYAVNDTIIP